MTHYFDYNATAPTRSEVVDAVTAVLSDGIGNPSSMHAPGRRARRLVDEARETLAALLVVDPREIVFTSGATESNNLALAGTAGADAKLRILTSKLEHASVRESARRLAREGRDVAAFASDSKGQPDAAALAKAGADEGPLLVSSIWANGETGHVVDPIAVRRMIGPRPLLHVDAAQAFGRIAPASAAAADLLSLSSHKLGGPPGVGALVVGPRARRRLVGIVVGGEQEDRLRAGTENVAALVGFAVAARLAEDERRAESDRLSELRERLWSKLEALPGDTVRISPDDGLPNTLTVATVGVSSAALVAGLDLAGFAVSTGSACAAAAPEPSAVLAALGVEPRYRSGVLRLSMGRETTSAAVDALADAFATVAERAREAA